MSEPIDWPEDLEITEPTSDNPSPSRGLKKAVSEPRDTNINPSQFLPPNGYQPIKVEPGGVSEPRDKVTKLDIERLLLRWRFDDLSDKTAEEMADLIFTTYKADLVLKIEGLKRGDEPLRVFSNNKPFKISQGEAWDFALDSVISIINKEGK